MDANSGERTLGENIADNVGMKAAYYAYKKYEAEKGADPELITGLSNDKLFFVGMAQVWCSDKKFPFRINESFKYNPHSKGPNRVYGVMKNSEEFANAYSCPVGSKMNPKNKCSLF